MEEFYKKKSIRDFLSLFSESKWKSLCLLCIEYGILNLKLKYQISSLSLDDIQEYVDELKDQLTKIAKSGKKKLRENNSEMVDKVSQKASTNNKRYASNGFKPSSEWRKGEEKTIFDVDNKENNNKESESNGDIGSVMLYNNSQNKGNYHYREQMGGEINTYPTTENTLELEQMELRKKREKILDDVLYPNQNHYVKNEYKVNNNFDKAKIARQYRTTYGGDYKKKPEEYYYVDKRYNIKKPKPFQESLQNNRKKQRKSNKNPLDSSFNSSGYSKLSLNRSTSSTQTIRFKSGLQKLKMKIPLVNRRTSSGNKSFFKQNYGGIKSKIKAQIEADRKIYELMKNNTNLM